jgi:hypothetical protein
MTHPVRVLTKAQFYTRAVPTFLLIVLWTAIMWQLSRMVLHTADPRYGSATIKLIHMACIDCFALSVLGMLVSLKWAVDAQWCLTIVGGVLWLAGRGQDQMIVTTLLLLVVPVLGIWLHRLKDEVVTETPVAATP